jgi:hypothetical protein
MADTNPVDNVSGTLPNGTPPPPADTPAGPGAEAQGQPADTPAPPAPDVPAAPAANVPVAPAANGAMAPAADPPAPPPWPTPAAKWTRWHSLALVAIVVAIGLVGWEFARPPHETFLITLVLLTVFATIAGHGTVGLWLGLLIDERNRMSLSRLQLALWTIVILSGFLAAALSNISHPGVATPLVIAIQPEMWLLMGISTTSLVGTPLILGTKQTEPSAPPTREVAAKQGEQAERTLDALERQGLRRDTVTTQGSVVAWMWAQDARFADLFQGEEIGNAAHLDLGKVQMFYFTLILVFAYVVMLTHSFAAPKPYIDSLPTLDKGMVALLGISHAGYLANKAVPHSTTS